MFSRSVVLRSTHFTPSVILFTPRNTVYRIYLNGVSFLLDGNDGAVAVLKQYSIYLMYFMYIYTMKYVVTSWIRFILQMLCMAVLANDIGNENDDEGVLWCFVVLFVLWFVSVLCGYLSFSSI